MGKATKKVPRIIREGGAPSTPMFATDKERGSKYTDPTPQQQAFLEACDKERNAVLRAFGKRMGDIRVIGMGPKSKAARRRFQENYDRIDWSQKRTG